MKRGLGKAKRNRMLSGTVSLAMVMGSLMGTGLSAYAETVDEGSEEGSAVVSHGTNPSFVTEESKNALLKKSESFPKQFDLRNVDTDGDEEPDRCYVTKVKMQGPFGSCWGFAAISSAETSILSTVLDDDPEAYKTLDLSEKQLAYFAKTYYNNPGDPQDGEGMHGGGTASEILDGGGRTGLAATTFATGTGVVNESSAPAFAYRGKNGYTEQRLVNGKYENYCYSADDDWSMDESCRFVQEYRLKESYFLPSPAGETKKGKYVYQPEGTAAIKEQLLEKRSVTINYSSDRFQPDQEGDDVDGEFISTKNWAHFSWKNNGPSHAVCIVGWDDDYPKENFPSAHQPEENGAWLVKNSWGTGEESFPNNGGGDWGLLEGQDKAPYEATSDVHTGYFWLSYYDRSIYAPESFAFEAAGDPEKTTLDQHDLMNAQDITYLPYDEEAKMANVFEAETNKRLNAISCLTLNPETTVKYEVYVLYSDGSGAPEDGVLMASGEEKFRYGGYHKIDLDTPVLIMKDQKYSIVITAMDEDGGNAVYVPYGEGEMINPGTGYFVGVINPGESFVFVDDEWKDMSEQDVQEELLSQDSWSWEYDAHDNFPIKGHCDVLPNLNITVRKSTQNLFWYDSDSFTLNEADYSIRFAGSGDWEMGTPEIRWDLAEGGDKIVEMTTNQDNTTAHFKAVSAGDTRVIISVAGLGLMSMPIHVSRVVPDKVKLADDYIFYPYTGEEIRPDFTVLANAEVELKEGEDYTVSYTDNVNCGLGFVKAKAAGKCLDPDDPAEASTFFFIVPPKAEIESVVTSSTSVRLQVSNFSDIGADGYYVCYKDSEMYDFEKVLVKGTDTELVLSGLTPDTEYQIMVCGVTIVPEEFFGGDEEFIAPGEPGDPVVVKTGAADYSSEWVDGKWYDADGFSTYPYEGKWMENSKGRWYQDEAGWYPKNRWQKIDGKYYFFDSKGYVECDAYRNGYYLGKDGVWDEKGKVPGWTESPLGWYFSLSNGKMLKNTWKKINGSWYYFEKNGVMASSCWVKGYRIEASGEWTYPWRGSWRKSVKGWWYGDTNGWYAKDETLRIDGAEYTFDQNGYWVE